MTYNEKKSLYESIMKDVAKQIKQRLNESVNSQKVATFFKLSKNYLNDLKKTDLKYRMIGDSVFEITKLVCIEPNTDISKEGTPDFINDEIWSSSKFVSSITDNQCIGDIMNNQQIVKNNVFKPSNSKRYFLICYPYDAIIKTEYRKEIMNPNKFAYALELDEDAIQNIRNEYNKYNKRNSARRDEYEQRDEGKKKKEYEKEIIYYFSKLKKNLREEDRPKANRIYKILNQLVDTFIDVFGYENGLHKRLMIEIIDLLNDNVKYKY